MSENKTPSPFDALTEAQKARLANLSSEIKLEKVTLSFLLESRGSDYTKKSSFYSVTACRDAEDPSWSMSDSKVVRALLSKHVISACYDDAVKRRMMSPTQAREELLPILAAYDAHIQKTLTNGSE